MSCTNKLAFQSGGPRGKRQSQRGNALIEFALGWSVLWFLFAGVYQYGYSFYVYNRLLTAVSNAAELGARINYDTGSPSTYTTKLQNMVLYGDESAGTTPIISGLTASAVNVIVTTDANSMPNDVTVSIGSSTTPFNVDAIFGNIALKGKPRATMKFMGQAICSTC